MTLYNRPEYLEQALAHLKKCRGIEDYLLLPQLEPGFPEVQRLINYIDFMAVDFEVNAKRLDCANNTFAAFSRAFKESDYVILVESDILLAEDALEFFEHCYRYKDDPAIFSICAYNREETEEHYMLYRKQWFTPWGVALFKRTWDEVREKWDHGHSWAGRLHKELRGDRYEIRPRLSRSQNIGAHGRFMPSAQFWRENHHTPWWAGDYHLTGGVFHE